MNLPWVVEKLAGFYLSDRFPSTLAFREHIEAAVIAACIAARVFLICGVSRETEGYVAVSVTQELFAAIDYETYERRSRTFS
jgi:hypothetical protein